MRSKFQLDQLNNSWDTETFLDVSHHFESPDLEISKKKKFNENKAAFMRNRIIYSDRQKFLLAQKVKTATSSFYSAYILGSLEKFIAALPISGSSCVRAYCAEGPRAFGKCIYWRIQRREPGGPEATCRGCLGAVASMEYARAPALYEEITQRHKTQGESEKQVRGSNVCWELPRGTWRAS